MVDIAKMQDAKIEEKEIDLGASCLSACMRPFVFIVSLFALGFGTFYPQIITNTMGHGNIYLLCVALFGLCTGFVYGVGFVARSAVGRLLLNPIAPLLLMILPVVVIKLLGH